MGGYLAYPEYKESGVEWLGEIPAHWEIKRLKFPVSLINEKVDAESSDLSYMGLEHIQSWSGERIEDENASSEGIASQFTTGDVLFGKLRPYLAKVHLAQHEGLASTEALVLRSSTEISSAFLRYYAVSRDFIDIVDSSTFGAKMPRASWDFIGNLPILVPSVEEQRQIAAFLDYKTGQIDALIAKKEALLEKLAEKRTALISQAVIKGLDPTVSMQDSGIPWLGDIPTHWDVVVLKRLAEVRGGVTKGRQLNDSDTLELPYLRVANVQDGYVDLSEMATIEILTSELERYSLKVGDVLMNEGGDNDKLGRGAVWNGEIEPCLHQNHVFSVRPNEISLSEWIALITTSSYAKFYFFSKAKQSTNLASISATNIKLLPIALPPEMERAKILNYLNVQNQEIDLALERISKAVNRIQEYRTALITNAVTGKIDVRDIKLPTHTPAEAV